MADTTEKKTFRKKVVLPSDKDETKVKFKPASLPKLDDKLAHVRLNAAAILREEARFKKEDELERIRLNAFMIEMRDHTEFER